MTLNIEQRRALDLVKKGKNIFLTGQAGTGKSYTIEKIYEYLVLKYGDKKVHKTSSTGASAILIGGKTLHSWAGIYLGKDTVSELVNNMKFPIKNRWKRAKALFIDEISMISPELFDKLEEIARILRRSEKPFGGLQVIISGDFFQLPAIIDKNDKIETKYKEFCFESNSWDKVIKHVITLKTNFRQKDKLFQKILEKVRYGEISDEYSDILEKRVNAPLNNEYGIEPTVIYPHKKSAINLNSERLEKLLKKEKKHTFIAKYAINYNNSYLKNDQLINKIKNMDDRTDDEILLTKGTQVVYKYNVDVENGIANGTRGIIEDFKYILENNAEEEGEDTNTDTNDTTNTLKKYPVVRLLNGNRHLATPVEFEYESKHEYKVIKEQVPLRLAWASTIHSCQGSSLDYVKADIGGNVFECGQAYVALSRVKNLEGLTLINYDPNVIASHPKVLEKFGPENFEGPLEKFLMKN